MVCNVLKGCFSLNWFKVQTFLFIELCYIKHICDIEGNITVTGGYWQVHISEYFTSNAINQLQMESIQPDKCLVQHNESYTKL